MRLSRNELNRALFARLPRARNNHRVPQFNLNSPRLVCVENYNGRSGTGMPSTWNSSGFDFTGRPKNAKLIKAAPGRDVYCTPIDLISFRPFNFQSAWCWITSAMSGKTRVPTKWFAYKSYTLERSLDRIEQYSVAREQILLDVVVAVVCSILFYRFIDDGCCFSLMVRQKKTTASSTLISVYKGARFILIDFEAG